MIRFPQIKTLCAAVATLLAGTALAGGADVRPVADDAVDQVIVKLTTPVSAGILAEMAQAAGVSLSFKRPMSGGNQVLALGRLLDRRDAEAVAQRLARLPFVVNAEPDYVMQPMAVPNDPLYAQQWHYFEATGGIGMPAAWDLTMGEADVYVAVLDTGILGDHEDLADRWIGGYDFISDASRARDGNGRDSDPSDEGDYALLRSSSWHGSHVAGTIGADSNNGIGVAGINWVSKIVPVRVLGKGGGLTSDIVDGIRWAAGLAVPGVPANPYPAQVLNMSLGGGWPCRATYQDAVDDVVGAGSVLVVAAGNSAMDASDFSPASCDDVITVAATNRAGDLSYYSNFGRKVEISAPGGETTSAGNGILSTLNAGKRKPKGDSYAFYQGTSMAAPHVAGVVSLMFSVNPSLTPAEVLDILQDTARDFPAGTDCAASATLCGVGIMDAAAAVGAAEAF